MSESRSHIELVQVAKNYIIDSIPEEYSIFVQMHSADTQRPQVLESFIPDVFVEIPDLLMIGEAKTINDFDREHSKAQFDVYLNKCDSFHGESCLVISVPWQIVPSAKNYFRRIKKRREYTMDIAIINELGEVAMV